MKSEKRHAERYDYPARIDYVAGSGKEGEVSPAVTINISRDGISLYAFEPLAEGREIEIRSRLPVGRYRATVRWVRTESDSMYKIGLVFSEEEQNNAAGKA
jgi:hypothetical protein